MRTYRTSSVKTLYAWVFWSLVDASAVVQNRQSIWSFHLVRCSSLRQACGNVYEQFPIQKATTSTSEVRIFIHRNSIYIALRNRKTFSRWTPWRSDFQACHGQQTTESSWRKSAGRIFAGWKFHRTYRNQSIPQHLQCVQQTTSPWDHFNQQFQGDWYQLSRCRFQGKKHRTWSQPKVHWVRWTDWPQAPKKESKLLSLWVVPADIRVKSKKCMEFSL